MFSLSFLDVISNSDQLFLSIILQKTTGLCPLANIPFLFSLQFKFGVCTTKNTIYYVYSTPLVCASKSLPLYS